MGSVAANFIPTSTGYDLGSDAQRWDAFLQNLDISGAISGAVALKYLNGIRFADQYTGATPAAQINAALADTGAKIVVVPQTMAAGQPTSIAAGQFVIDLRGTFKVFSNASVTTPAFVIADNGAVSLGTALADSNLAQIATAGKVSTAALTGAAGIADSLLAQIATAAKVNVSAITGTLPVANGGTGAATATGTGNAVLQTSPTLTTPVINGQSNQRLDVTLANGANVDVNIGGNSFIRIVGPTGVFSISGFTGGADGRVLRVYNSVAYAMTITNNSASTTTNRITTLTGSDVVLTARTSFADFIYDSAASRWILAGTY